MAKKYSINNGVNSVITGYPQLDVFFNKTYNPKNIWKHRHAKKIIWSPHHSIEHNDNFIKEAAIEYSSFLENYKIMIKIVSKYKDEIQFCFKPHPLLKIKLYNHEQWGRKKTDAYFDMWNKLPNTQMALSNYEDIFLTSNAIINDSGSFVAEYLCVKKPSLFLFRNNNTKDQFNDFGKIALDISYHAYCKDDIINFIESIVLKDNDTKKQSREDFVKKYLIPQNGKMASENVYNYVKKECKK